MRQNIYYKKDPEDKEEICFSNLLQIPKIKKAFNYVRNIIAQEKCDYNKKCYWIKCDKDIDLNHILESNNEDIYIKNLVIYGIIIVIKKL